MVEILSCIEERLITSILGFLLPNLCPLLASFWALGHLSFNLLSSLKLLLCNSEHLMSSLGELLSTQGFFPLALSSSTKLRVSFPFQIHLPNNTRLD